MRCGKASRGGRSHLIIGAGAIVLKEHLSGDVGYDNEWVAYL